MLALILILSASPVQQIHVVKMRQGTFTMDDYPVLSVHRKDAGEVAARATVSPDGKTERCEIVSSSGVPLLDQWTCRLMFRTRFEPASDAMGKPAYGIWLGRIIRPEAQAQKGYRESTAPIGIYVKVDNLPSAVSTPVHVALSIAVDALGHASTCSPEEGQSAPPALQTIACSQALKIQWKPAVTRAGIAMPSIQPADIYFLRSTDPEPLIAR